MVSSADLDLVGKEIGGTREQALALVRQLGRRLERVGTRRIAVGDATSAGLELLDLLWAERAPTPPPGAAEVETAALAAYLATLRAEHEAGDNW